MARIHRLGEVDSTMDEAHRLAEGGAEDGTVVVADRQRVGRGRLGRGWVAEEGGLWLSVIRRDPGEGALDPLSPRLGLALATALEEAIPGLANLRLKWPNDLLVGGRKVAGVLVETRWHGSRCSWLVAGIGVNLTNPIPAALQEQATALGAITAVPAPEDLVEPVATKLRAALDRVDPLDAAELLAWSVRDALQGQPLEAPIPGVAEGITPAGSLRVRRRDGRIVEVRTGEVAASG